MCCVCKFPFSVSPYFHVCLGGGEGSQLRDSPMFVNQVETEIIAIIRHSVSSHVDHMAALLGPIATTKVTMAGQPANDCLTIGPALLASGRRCEGFGTVH